MIYNQRVSVRLCCEPSIEIERGQSLPPRESSGIVVIFLISESNNCTTQKI